MRWAGNVERMGRIEIYTGFWWGTLMERNNLKDVGVDGKKIFKWIFKK